MASDHVKQLIADELFGSFVRLKNQKTGQEVLVEKFHWLSIKDLAIIEFDAVLPECIHLYETSRILHHISTTRVIDVPDKREWVELPPNLTVSMLMQALYEIKDAPLSREEMIAKAEEVLRKLS